MFLHEGWNPLSLWNGKGKANTSSQESFRGGWDSRVERLQQLAVVTTHLWQEMDSQGFPDFFKIRRYWQLQCCLLCSMDWLGQRVVEVPLAWVLHTPSTQSNRFNSLSSLQASLVAQMVKNLPATQETWVWSLGWEAPLEKGMATHSSILAWRIPSQRSLMGYSPLGCKELDTTEWITLSLFFYSSLHVTMKWKFFTCPGN